MEDVHTCIASTCVEESDIIVELGNELTLLERRFEQLVNEAPISHSRTLFGISIHFQFSDIVPGNKSKRRSQKTHVENARQLSMKLVSKDIYYTKTCINKEKVRFECAVVAEERKCAVKWPVPRKKKKKISQLPKN
jgi:hypothetical protein